ncbi:MAG TPA: hemolysin family protein [Verrucomicrobiae bacterium]|jgi:putative hemolysin|nr:hemolysin family protein [Verrucomicrobiae bacterium]
MEQAVAAILIFAGASFFFALAETALFSLGKWQARQMAERHPLAGKIVAQLLERPQDLLATLALGNTFANAAMLAVALRMVFNSHWALALTMIALAAFVLIGCEVLPKTLAVRRPEHWALRVGWLLLIFQKITKPLHRAAQRLDAAILKRVAPQSAAISTTLTDAEYHELLEMAYRQGTLAESEKEIILQIIGLDRRMARDVMRPRAGMACISDDATVGEMIAAAKKFKHRRLPIYDETPDTIVGILNTRALLLDPKIDLSEVIEFPSFVPETMNLLHLFQSLQKQHRGLAVVLDEFGGVAGLVTMEDILGELIGKIRAEAQPEGFVMEKISPGRWRVNGSMRLEDFRREYPALGNADEVETMGGLLTHMLGVVPNAGDSATFHDLKFTAQIVDERRVRELLVQRMK